MQALYMRGPSRVAVRSVLQANSARLLLPPPPPRPCPSNFFPSSAACLRWRASTPRFASKRTATPPLRHAHSPPLQGQLARAAARAPGAASYNPMIQQLASRPSPMLIYQSESKAPYVTGCFVLGGICVAYAVFNGGMILFDPLINPSTFVKVAYGLVCSAMLGFGCALFYKTFRIVRSITVVPTALANGQRTVRLRLESGNFRSKTVDVPYDVASTSRRLFVPPSVMTTGEERLRRIEAAKKRQEWERQRILTLPFRQAGRLFSGFFQGFKSVVSDDEWIFLRVRGRSGRWKIYEKPAWALRNGKHVDDLTRRM